MKYIKTFEVRGRPRTKWVKCIKDYEYVLPDDFTECNPQLVLNDKKVYQFFESGKMYKMDGPFHCISGDYIVHVHTDIKHTIGPPDYEKYVSTVFLFDSQKERKKFDSQLRFEDYFEMTEETKNLIHDYYIKKDSNKFNI